MNGFMRLTRWDGEPVCIAIRSVSACAPDTVVVDGVEFRRTCLRFHGTGDISVVRESFEQVADLLEAR